MKQANKTSKLLIAITLVVLAFFCSFSVTYSYFTANVERSGAVNFSNFDVRFVYTEGINEKPTGTYTQDNLYTINLYPVGGTIALGEPFDLAASEGGEKITNLKIKNMVPTSKAYVRFWIDAYPVIDDAGNVDTSVNYGKFFFFEITNSFLTRGGSNSAHEEAESCYFLTYDLAGSHDLGNRLTVKATEDEEIPEEALGCTLKISITLEAVQASHTAFKQVFNDNKGYHVSWK